MTLADLTDAEVRERLDRVGSIAALAQQLDMPRQTLREHLGKRGIGSPRSRGAGTPSRRRPKPTVTKESLLAAMQPPNNCKVKAFLDALDDESQGVVTEALGYRPEDLRSGVLRDWLVGLGFHSDDVPGQDAINDHRAGRRPCRCHG